MDLHDRPRPFEPPQERQAGSWLKLTLLCVVLALLTFRFGVPQLEGLIAASASLRSLFQPKTGASKDSPSALTSTQRASSNSTLNQAVPSDAFKSSTPTPPQYGTGHFVKCVVAGKTSFGDTPCPAGASQSMVSTLKDSNVLAAIRPSVPPPLQSPPPGSPAAMQANAISESADEPFVHQKAQCAGLDERIKYLDALARQPQTGPTQDWIRSERKITRDAQYRLRC